MVDICGTFAKSHNLTFSTNICAKKSKTKCILFAKRVPNMENIAPILLNGTPLPWVDQITHLGHILQNDNSMNIDCNIKRGQFIGKVHSLLQEFYFSFSYCINETGKYLLYLFLWKQLLRYIF